MLNYVLENAPIAEYLKTCIGEGDCSGYKTTINNSDKLVSIIHEFIDLMKTKNLSVRQAQEVFLICSDYIMNCKCD